MTIIPPSQLTNTVPELRPTHNWYFDLPHAEPCIQKLVNQWERDEQIRTVVVKTVRLLFNWQLPVLLLLAFGITSLSAISKPARYALAAQLTTGPERVAINSLLTMPYLRDAGKRRHLR